MSRVPLSVLDLAPTSVGRSRKQALDDARELARVAEGTGYLRYWMAEHHGSDTFMSSATSLLLARAAEHTSTIRLGAGGVMLPNHAPLMVAEYYGTLATIYGDRFDLGLGRAPGTSPAIAAQLHRGSAELPDFANEVATLARYLGPKEHNSTPVRAIPGEGTSVEMWVLGSSLGGAQVAAVLGLPFSFASHFAPAQLADALAVYREQFRPGALDSGGLDGCPRVMAGVNVVVAPTQAEADLLFTTSQRLRDEIRSGVAGPLIEPVADLYPPHRSKSVDPRGIVGTPQAVVEQLQQFVAAFGVDELIVTSYTHDPGLRRRSHELLADAWHR